MDWPVTGASNPYGPIYNDTKIRYGDVVLKNGDSLRGWMKILPYYNGAFRTIDLLPDGEYSRIMSIERTRINHVRAYRDAGVPDSGYTDFVNLRDKDLWRKLASKDSSTIYDDYTPNFDPLPFGYEMILTGKSHEFIKIYHHRYHDFDAEILPRIARFINKRYAVHFQPADFKDVWAMIRYILDRESAEAGGSANGGQRP